MSSNTDIEELKLRTMVDSLEGCTYWIGADVASGKITMDEADKARRHNKSQALAETNKLIQQKVIEAQQSLISEYQRVLSIKQDGLQISLYEFGLIINMDKKRMWHELAQLNHNKKGDSNDN